jgi:colanic acid biosynthesis glycosyl transferase WcaI
MSDHRVWFLSDVFYPETEGVAHFVTRIAVALAARFDVRVVSAQPNYSLRNAHCSSNETWEGVAVHRSWATRFNRQWFLGRMCNNVTFCVTVFLYLLRRLRAGDYVFATSSPPMVPFVALVACRLRHAKCILNVYDVYPDIAVVGGVLKEGSLIAKVLCRLQRWLYQNVDSVVTIGRDMQALIQDRIKDTHEKVHVVPLFASTDEIFPLPRMQNKILNDNGLLNNFIVQVAGNIGPVHNIETLLESARLLEDTPNIKFLIIGSGKKFCKLEALIHKEQRSNVVLLSRMPRNESCNILNACDIAINALFVPGMWGLANPSRTYGIMAAGKPMIAMADDGAEATLLVEEQQIGWCVQPGDADGLAKAVRDAYDRRAELTKIGERARHVAETKYRIEEIVYRYASMLSPRPSKTRLTTAMPTKPT